MISVRLLVSLNAGCMQRVLPSGKFAVMQRKRGQF
jgi:hypothetical protein